MTDPPPTPTYAEAVAELDRILADLDADRIDIDALGEAVSRAAFLIESCRERLDTAKAGVEEIIAGLGRPAEPPSGPPDKPTGETPESPEGADE